MFSSKNTLYFIFSVLCIILAYVLMSIDAEPSGFGLLTLWIAPPLLLVGFTLPVPGILGTQNLSLIKPTLSWKSVFCGLARNPGTGCPGRCARGGICKARRAL